MYCTKRIIDSSSENKIVYLINYHILKANKGEGFAEDIRQLMRMFPDTEKLINSISIVLTHAPSRVKTQEFINTLKSLIKQNNYFNDLNDIINELCSKPNIVSVFRAPERNSDKNYMNDELRRSINVGIENSCFNKIEVRNSLSSKAIEAVECLIKCYENEIQAKMDIFTNSLIVKFKSETNLNTLAENESVLDKFVSDCNDLSIETFISSLRNLSEHFTGSRSIINEFKNLAIKIIFFSNYRRCESGQININSWLNKVLISRAELTNRIQIIKAEKEILKERIKSIAAGCAAGCATGVLVGGGTVVAANASLPVITTAIENVSVSLAAKGLVGIKAMVKMSEKLEKTQFGRLTGSERVTGYLKYIKDKISGDYESKYFSEFGDY
ncbi:hypothetical protein SteCoe_18688 [Stentor coeruleus]|uniref:Uncharacterized protein n=1 Tax=Stentor coeruleus TaxID=5963 RepID=A0A1R2BVY0_9CILI|nr:hypothetical protein SteCoe_18688 [Stentor coeruleus]